MSKHILFVCHEASRTGAPFLLLHLLRWLKENSSLTWEVFFKEGGELVPEFEALSPVTVWNERQAPTSSQIWNNRARRIAGKKPTEWNQQRLHQLAGRLAQNKTDLIYSNTVTNGYVLEALADLKCPVLCHAHELEFVIREIDGENIRLSFARTDHYIAASHAVKENLIRNHATAAQKVDVVHEFVPMTDWDEDQIARTKKTIRGELGLAPDDRLVLGAGSVDWRKGSDLWVQVAAATIKRDASIHFVWVGGAPDAKLLDRLNYDIDKLGIAQHAKFIGARANLLDYFAAADVFAMTSREDPYPLVNLEAASVGKPIVCFQDGGGTPELVEDDCGFVVPYLDVNAMSTRISELLDSPALRQQMGARAAQKVRERHDVACSAPQILQVIEKCLSHES